MVEISEDSKYDHVRLSKKFYPEKYHLDVFVDIYNISYKILLEIDLSVKESYNEIIILNSINKFFEIRSIKFQDYDPIADHFIEYNEAIKLDGNSLKFCFTEELIEFSNSTIELFSKFKLLYEKSEFDSLSSDKKCYLFKNFIKENQNIIFNPFEVSMYEKIIDMNCENLNIFDLLENFNLKKLKEEAVYIKLSRKYNIGEKLKVILDIEGRVRCNEERYMGFFISIFGPQSIDLQLGRHEFIKLWRKNMKNEDNYLKNAIFTVAGEPIEFRTVFPCFDEPCFKSKFNLKISIEKKILEYNLHLINNFKVLSNGELLEINEIKKFDKKCVEYKFSESPLMSIYLLTWTIGYYDYVETISNSITIRAYTLLDRQAEASFALDLAKKALEYYRNYFKIPYMFHKLDLVPIPNLDFRALECWGCILFLNYALLVNKFLDIKEKKNVARTIVHELCHIWFGNLVTMDWWDDIWLNEGFARFLEFECLKEIKPEFQIDYKFIESFFQDALIIDESPYTHPVRGVCPSPRNLPVIFDTISYAKGASCIRMLYFFVGKETFSEVISKYLIEFKYKNTNTQNLWNVFKKFTNFDIESIMYNWVNVSGHPALYVNISDDKQKLIINQSPFPKNLNLNIDENKLLWKIPLFIKTQDKEIIFLMDTKSLELELEKDLNISYEKLASYEHFIKINFDMKGFYRVFYDTKENVESYKNRFSNLMNEEGGGSSSVYFDSKENWKNNKKYLFENLLLFSLLTNHKKLSSLDIVGIMNDYLIINDFSTCLNIIDMIKPVTDYLVLFYVHKIYNFLRSYLFKYSPFKEFLLEGSKELLKNEFEFFKFPKESQEIEKFLKEDYNLLFEIMEKLNDNLFSKVIDFESLKEEYFEKIYVKDPLCYLNESKDEFLELALYYGTCVGKNQDIINYILKNFNKGKSRIHKNLKYEVYHIANVYSFQVFKDFNQEISLFKNLLKEYMNEFYDLSLQGKFAFKNSFLDLESASDELVTYFIFNMKNEEIMSEIYFKNVEYFKKYPTNRKKFIDCYIQIITNDFLDKKNIFSGNIQFINFLKNHPILKKEISQILDDIEDWNLAKIIINYIFNSFKKLISNSEKRSLYNVLVQNIKFDSIDMNNVNRLLILLRHTINFLESK